jgi:hypothetical protein
MLAQAQVLPPPLHKLAATPVLASEMPPGFTRTKIVLLAPNARLHTLGAVRIDFFTSHANISASYALTKTNAAAVRLAHTEASISGGSLFHVRALAVGRFAIAVTGRTVAEASNLLRLAVAHLRRSGAQRGHPAFRPAFGFRGVVGYFDHDGSNGVYAADSTSPEARVGGADPGGRQYAGRDGSSR